MAEFTSLNGYQVKDIVARNIAKGRNQAVAFVDYATMIETLNEFEKDEFRAGQNVYIGVVGVPDLWVYSVEDIRHTFTYTSDEDFVEMLKNNTTVQVGFFKLAMLEGQKVDLTTVNEQLASHTNNLKALSKLGAKNLLNNNATSKTESGITFTINKDKSITLDGTAEENVRLYLYHNGNQGPVSSIEPFEVGKEYIFSCKGIQNGFVVNINPYDGASYSTIYLSGSEPSKSFTWSDAYVGYRVLMQVDKGTVANNVTVYPMIRLASITDSTYEPYAMTNRQLTENLGGLSFGYDAEKDKYGYWKKEADTDVFVPFSSIDYANCYTDLAIFRGEQTAYHNIYISRELHKGKYVVSWSTFWTWYNNNGFHLSPVCGGFGSSYNPKISKLKDSTIVEYVDSGNGSTGQLGVVTIEEDSDTITITQTGNGFNTATAFFMKIG